MEVPPAVYNGALVAHNRRVKAKIVASGRTLKSSNWVAGIPNVIKKSNLAM